MSVISDSSATSTGAVRRRPSRAAAWRRVHAVVRGWPLVVPGALTAWLAFNAGGFFPGATGVAAAATAVLAVLWLTGAGRPLGGWSWPLTAAVGGFAVLAVLTLLSAGWSHAPFRAVTEFDRTLLYLLVVALLGARARRPGDAATVLRWVAVAIFITATYGLLSRLRPDLVASTTQFARVRLASPLTYWNALGVFTAVGLVLALNLTSSTREHAAVRVVAAGMLPVLAVTAYFTFSRGGIAAAGLGLVCYAVLAHPRGLLTGALAVVPTTAFALTRAYDAAALSSTERLASPLARAQGRSLLETLVVCVLAAMAIRALGLLVDRRLERVRPGPRTSRSLGLGAVVVVAVAVAVVVVTWDVPERVADAARSFVNDPPGRATGNARDRLTVISNNGRLPTWKVAWATFRAHPLHGTGAGTFRLVWERRRATDFRVNDAHSLYLEMLGELGVLGGVALALALGAPLVGGLIALRRERHAAGAFLAAWLALLVHAGVDWDWEMPALFVGLLGAAGVLLARPATEPQPAPAPARIPRIVGALALLLLAATPALVATSQGPLETARRAFAAGNCPDAIDAALTSASRFNPQPEPYEILGYCDVRLGAEALAVRAMTAAAQRDPQNWTYVYGRAVLRGVAGQDPRPAARHALALNRHEPLAIALVRRLRSARTPAQWRRVCARAQIPQD